MSHLTQDRIPWALTPSSTGECVTVEEARLWLREPTTLRDSIIARAITEAREHLEDIQSLQVLTGTLVMKLDAFPDVIRLARTPVTSVTSIAYVDTDGDPQTLSASSYLLDSASLQARITPAFDEIWPSVRMQTGAVTVTFIAGYATADVVPAGIKNDILRDMADIYQHLSSTLEIRVSENEMATSRRATAGMPTVV